ncbi:MAG: hypothetical protein KIT84_01135 [Labilithrix sp.]|nr:hypothetical protein [Labilithrix sp.]MCW5809589.1 hypothetical protein [Labilithrix sp.]
MTTKLDTYVSSGSFAADIERFYPDRPVSQAAPGVRPEQLEKLPASVKKELLALDALARAGKVPALGKNPGLRVGFFDFGYSLAEDLGDELEEVFEDGGKPLELARTAIGLADNGGGVMFCLLEDGTVAGLSMESFHSWQWYRFDDLGTFCWVLLHGTAVGDDKYPVEDFKAKVAELDCALTAKVLLPFSKEILPPLPEHLEDMPAWLQ